MRQNRIARVTIEPHSSRDITGALIVAPSEGMLVQVPNGEIWSFKEGALRWIGDKSTLTYTNGSNEPVSLLALTLRDQ